MNEVCRSSLSKLEHIIRPRNDTLFFPLEKEIEALQSAQNNKPENKNYFLSETHVDSSLFLKANQLPKISINNNSEQETSLSRVSEPMDVIKTTESSTTDKLLSKTNEPNLDDKFNIEESTTYSTTKKNSDIATDVNFTKETPSSNGIQFMDVENSFNSNSKNETLAENNEGNDDNVKDMLRDFIDIND